MTKPLHELSISEAGAGLRSGAISSVTLTEHALARISWIDPLLHSFIYVSDERAKSDARRADAELRAGIDRGPLHGIPYALKDVLTTAGIPTTCNSKLMLDHIPSNEASIETRLKRGGAVLLGKLNTHEFALGGPSFDLPFEPARNPWQIAHYAGGSSSGCAVAVAAGLVRVTFGTDTSGSIRGPACLCGVVGLKPTYGLVSCRGAFPLSYSLDHTGPLASSVEDAAIAMNVISGHDPRDSTSADTSVPDFTSRIGEKLDGLRIGYARSFFVNCNDVSAEVIAAADAAAEVLARLGAVIEEVVLPNFDLFKACGRVIMTAEAYAIHEHNLRNRPLDYGRYTYQRMIAGCSLTAADLVQAFRLRQELTRTVNSKILTRYDALITAAALAPAPALEEFPEDWPPPSGTIAALTIAFNVTGNPALCVPAGFSKTRLPLGMQIVGRPFEEPTLFRIGAAYSAASGLCERHPELWHAVNGHLTGTMQ